MIDLTPLDVRKKKGDFAKTMRGYDPQEVDHFLELVAERLEELVRETMTLRERVEGLEVRVRDQDGREKAVQEALVTAQALREEMKEQAKREAELVRREAEGAAQLIRDRVERFIEERRGELRTLSRARARFLAAFRTLLERQMDVLWAEEASPPPLDVDLESIGRRLEAPPGTEEMRSLDSLLTNEASEPGGSASCADGSKTETRADGTPGQAEPLDPEDASAVPDVEEVQEPGIAESERSGV